MYFIEMCPDPSGWKGRDLVAPLMVSCLGEGRVGFEPTTLSLTLSQSCYPLGPH